MAVGTEAYTYDNSIEFYEKVPGPKEKYIVQDAGHFDLYWMPEYANPVADKVADFFKKHM